MICPECKKHIDDDSLYCVFCGKAVASAGSKSSGRKAFGVLVIANALMVIVLAVFCVSLANRSRPSSDMGPLRERNIFLETANASLSARLDSLELVISGMEGDADSVPEDGYKEQYETLLQEKKRLERRLADAVRRAEEAERKLIEHVNKTYR